MAKTKAAFEGSTFSADPASEIVWVKVTRRGDGRISTGVHDNQGGDVLYEQGETFPLARHIADVHELNGYVEIGNFAPSGDHDNNGEFGGAAKRGPGRPPKTSE